MSIFDGDESEISEIIDFFNSLTDEEKAIIVSDLHPETFKLKKYFDRLVPLLFRVQRDLSKYEDIAIGSKLVELGMEETYARLIVSNMKKQAPTLSYHASQIAKIDDGRFVKDFERMLMSIWINNEDKKVVVEKYGITHDQFESIAGVTNHILEGLFHGNMTEKKVLGMLVENGLSDAKAQAILRGIQPHRDTMYSRLMFSNLQEVMDRTQDIEAQNRAIVERMNEIIRLLRKIESGRGLDPV